jgi:hypothetical protein
VLISWLVVGSTVLGSVVVSTFFDCKVELIGTVLIVPSQFVLYAVEPVGSRAKVDGPTPVILA